MKINIKATAIELTPAITKYVEKKIGSLDKYIRNEDAVAQVEVGRTTQHHNKGDVFKAEVHVTGAGLDVYAAVEKEDLYVGIDAVKDEIVRNVLGKKEKETMARRGARYVKDVIKGLNFFKRRG
jgi:ribosomal subunit interface protein